MMKARLASNGAVVAPHHLASMAGARILMEGGNAIEAMIAAAATIAVVYPHMNGIGGDGFWLIAEPGEAPRGIEACGPAAALATKTFFKEKGFKTIPSRGPNAAVSVAGTVAGWGLALEAARSAGGQMPLNVLLHDAVAHARAGVPVTESQATNLNAKAEELAIIRGFADFYMPGGRKGVRGSLQSFPRLAETLERIGEAGTDDFYRGELAEQIAGDLQTAGSPLRLKDLQSYQARWVDPLTVKLRQAQLYNMPPPTQGLSSLMILALFEKLAVTAGESFDHVHGLVEATKQAFLIRNAHVQDPAAMPEPAERFLRDYELSRLVHRIDPARALAWPQESASGDTVWLGAIDGDGRAVSFIQSLFWEFGSGVVLPQTGILWQNRGSSFSLADQGANQLAPGRKPFHTLNPALASFSDGRRMVYGTMGGEGQPQTQAALFSRYGLFGQDLQQAVSAPRWLLGRTWGAGTTTLKLEADFDAAVVEALAKAGHETEIVPAHSEMMGHAGALVRHASGLIEGAFDPRSDGSVAAF